MKNCLHEMDFVFRTWRFCLLKPTWGLEGTSIVFLTQALRLPVWLMRRNLIFLLLSEMEHLFRCFLTLSERPQTPLLS